ncbi:flagellin lysine-N-methylase [Tepidibacter hydrothermalis]|uniref:Flagellin lysine-N-methylase n=1 Tax=Tepidibacter hydrothermalis TaxID=3036126 RepID=A0ABY8EAT8_9FIRM|nr:flagellin lysine-N-methylase [Tepidibacter hydrothermalis]WFD10037.1 flagellin lysine-N-methylase [Tepidibacter hydrothermalis]
MSNLNKRTLLTPQYMKNFKCIGGACEDTCCVGWGIHIDKETYKKYRNCKDKQMREHLNKNITRQRSNPSNIAYAKIRLDEDKGCPFLSENKLCEIYSNLGEEYLSLTCTDYPRMYNKVNGVIEKSASMSCPEAARLALLNPNVMEFDQIEEHFNKKVLKGKEINTHKTNSSNKIERYFQELRVFTIQILQNREYELWERLIILGLFYQKLDEYIKDDKINEIPELIQSYINDIYSDKYKGVFESIPTQITVQMELLKELTDDRVLRGVASDRYMQCLKECLIGIMYTEEATKEEISQRYKLAYEKYYNPYMSRHEYILENYLVNYVFKNVFPSSKKDDIFDTYVMMIIHYSMIKMHLIGMAGFYKEKFEDKHVIKLIQAFAKVIEHNESYLENAYKLLKLNGFTTMSYMAILLKN